MTRAKTMWLLAARWLVVLTASLVVMAGNILTGAPAAPIVPKQSCSASCAKKCPCCISTSAPVPTSAPLAPSSSRLAVEKNFQFAPWLTLLLVTGPALSQASLENVSDPHFPASLPVFLRHRALLI